MTPGDPKVFLMYSYDDPDHAAWVARLAERLRSDCILVTLDQWSLLPGDSVTYFMEKAIHENPNLVLVCTPGYRTKFDLRNAGVGYEGSVLSGVLLLGRAERRCIPLLREGQAGDSIPSMVGDRRYLDFRGDPYQEASYQELLATLLVGRAEGRPATPPQPLAVGEQPLSWRRLLTAALLLALLTFALPRLLAEAMGTPADLESALASFQIQNFVLLGGAVGICAALFVTAKNLRAGRPRQRDWMARSLVACALGIFSIVVGLYTAQAYAASGVFDPSTPQLAGPLAFAALYLLGAVACLIMTFL